MSKARIAGELVVVYAGVALITALITYTNELPARELSHLLLSGTFLFTALTMARRDARGASHYGIDLEGVLEPRAADQGLAASLRGALPVALRELGFAAKLAALIFPPFVLLFALWHGVEQPFTFQPPPHPLDFALGQLLVVALPEEALFRGYFQTRLGDLFARETRIFGASLCLPALALSSVLFALLHFLVGFQASRLAVFFPALVFGYMRARRGGIGAAVWFHAMCNALSELLTRGWL